MIANPAGAQLRIIILCAGTDEDGAPQEALVGAGQALLRTQPGATLEMLRLRGPGDARNADLHGVSVWWDYRHPQLRAQSCSAAWAHAALDALTAMEVGGGTKALVLLPPGPANVGLAAHIAGEIEGVSVGGCIDIAVEGDAIAARRPAYGGRAVASLRTSRWPCFAALRPAHASAAVALPAAGELRTLESNTPLPNGFATTPLPGTDSQRPLTSAQVVVSGGRGMGGADGFALLAQLATQLDAALGGSLPTVDAGWVPVSRQIGQSGKFVSPRTYVAVGISGTPQHMAGLSAESRIIALNKDPGAPIFQLAQIGVVGEWQEILPLVLARLTASPDAPAPPLR